MAKLQEHWRGRVGEKEILIEEGKRPDLVALQRKVRQDRERMSRKRAEERKVKSLQKIVQANSTLDKIVEPNKLPELADILKEVFTSDSLKRKLKDSDSPAILQWILNRLYGGEGQGEAIIVKPTIFRVVKSGESIGVLEERPLGIEPSGQGEGLKIEGELEKLDTPTPPKSPSLNNSCMSLGNDSEISGSQPPPTYEI